MFAYYFDCRQRITLSNINDWIGFWCSGEQESISCQIFFTKYYNI